MENRSLEELKVSYAENYNMVREQEGLAGVVGHMRSHLGLMIHRICTDQNFDILNLTSDQREVIVNIAINGDPQLGAGDREENKGWIEAIFSTADKICSSDTPTLEKDILNLRDNRTEEFAKNAKTSILKLSRPKSPLKTVELDELESSFDNMLESSLDYAFYKKLLSIGCEVKSDDNIRDLLMMELESIEFGKVLNNFVSEDLEVFNQRNSNDSRVEAWTGFLERISMPVGIVAGGLSASLLRENKLDPSLALTVVFGSSAAIISAPNLMNYFIGRSEKLSDQSISQGNLNNFQKLFLEIGETVDSEYAEAYFTQQYEMLVVKLSQLNHVKPQNLDVLFAMMVKFKKRMDLAMAAYDMSHEPTRVKMLSGIAGAVMNIVGNYAAAHINWS